MKNIIIAVISTWLILYFAGAFISWQPNPALWSMDGRFCFAFAALVFGFFAGIAAYIHSDY